MKKRGRAEERQRSESSSPGPMVSVAPPLSHPEPHTDSPPLTPILTPTRHPYTITPTESRGPLQQLCPNRGLCFLGGEHWMVKLTEPMWEVCAVSLLESPTSRNLPTPTHRHTSLVEQAYELIGCSSSVLPSCFQSSLNYRLQ
ncbi:unnamed protein product [Pleuronectes platessa]|uniref:Uncharacterized protein n=1 Tax=Pleuronectes platessa TaxID=8262 RepID=A0A9N7TVS3_PLEPL|nr:unnamed protein product [Pleuronectes platessa]